MPPQRSRLIALHVRIEQEQGVARYREGPHTRKNRPGSRLDLDDDRHALADRELDREPPTVDGKIVLMLPAVAIEPLREVALVAVEAHADGGRPRSEALLM